MAPFTVAESAQWNVGRVARILVAAGVLDRNVLARVESDLHAAIYTRSRLLLNWERRRGTLHRTLFAPSRHPSAASFPPRAMRVTPVGRTLTVASDPVPITMHLLSLVRTETEAVLPAVVHKRCPLDDSATDYLPYAAVGSLPLPYDQLWAVDDRETRYAVQLEGSTNGSATWQGIARLTPAPPRDARWLDLIGDGTALIRLPLSASLGCRVSPALESTVTPGERLLLLTAERILADEDTSRPVAGQDHGGAATGPQPGEIIAVLTESGAIAPGSLLASQIAALCQRLGRIGHGITVPPAPEVPTPWASVITQRDAQWPGSGREVFAPLAAVLPDFDGARFTLAGLSTTAGKSYLHLVSAGAPRLAEWFASDWTPGFSWWVRDGNGSWHVGIPGEPYGPPDGMQAFQLRLTPPLIAIPCDAEVVVSGPTAQVQSVVPIYPVPEPSN